MIFSKLFNTKAKWQSKDSNIRITAIKDDLQLTHEQDVQVLKQLASNDENDLVRRSALLKLDQFSVWLTAYENDKNNGVKNLAFEHVINSLASDTSSALSQTEKLAFVQDKMTTPMAEATLEKSSQSDMVIALIEKINKPQKLTSLFFQKPILEVQQYILGKIDETNALEKLLKKAKDEAVIALITDKLSAIEQAKQKPVKLLKDVQMVLSKLLALKEQKDYQQVLAKRSALSDEWKELVQSFDCLADSDREQSHDKFTTINTQLDKVFAQMKEQYEQELIAQKTIEEKRQAQHKFDALLAGYNTLFANAVFEDQPIDEQSLKADIDLILNDIAGSPLHDQEKKQFTQRFSEQLVKIQKIPKIAESVTHATQLISKMSQQLPPENLAQLAERYDFFKQWQQEFKTVEQKAAGAIPSSIAEAKDEIVKQWQGALKPLQTEQNKLFFQAQKKVSDLKRLIATGKYNASFGVYKRFKKLFEQLSSHQQHRLQRDYDSLTEKVTELSDWEHYIATPRKQQLLDEVKLLIESPLDNPNAQAEKVKASRKIWNSLGHADEDVDKELNDAFNEACEKAFAPCRVYYAEQEKLREQHLVVRKDLISAVQALSSKIEGQDIDFKSIEAALNKINQQWREAGEVDRSVYRVLNQEFIVAAKPVKTRIHQYHEENATEKQKLIAQVIAQHDNDNVFEAVNVVKDIQAKWKNIGYAGPKQENSLWAEFRKVNDIVFSRRDDEKSKNKGEVEQRIQRAEQALSALSEQLSSADSKTDFNHIKHQLNDLREAQLSEKPVIKQVMNAIDAMNDSVKSQLSALDQQEKIKSWQTIFSLVEDIAAARLTKDQINEQASFTTLTVSKQKRLQDALNKTQSGDRAAKTIELEILAGVDSPASVQSERMKIQVSLMQEQMTSGQSADLDKAFYDWLAINELTCDDEALIDRIKAIYMA